MTIISLVMIVAFAIVYFTTYSNIQAENRSKLEMRSGKQISIEGSSAPRFTNTIDPDLDPNKGGLEKHDSMTNIVTQQISSEDTLSFDIEVDAKGKILSTHTVFSDITPETYQQATEIALKNPKSTKAITLNGRQWQYALTSMKTDIYQNGVLQTIDDGSTQIRFLDVTESKKTLAKLLQTLGGVGLLMLLVIFLFSYYFANRAIKPIAVAWDKQKQFVADASHELKTPLAIINANCDAITTNPEETIQSQKKWFDYIRIGSDRMAKLINDLLTLTRLEEVNTIISKNPFNLSKEITDIALALEAVMIDKKICFSASIEPDIIVESDAERFKQLVTILFDNAIKYTNEAGQIELSLMKGKRQAVFSIKNTGKGITQQDLPKIFDRFYRSDPARAEKTGGYGLGLSIAKMIVEQLGGKINVESIENKYTVFTVHVGL